MTMVCGSGCDNRDKALTPENGCYCLCHLMITYAKAQSGYLLNIGAQNNFVRRVYGVTAALTSDLWKVKKKNKLVYGHVWTVTRRPRYRLSAVVVAFKRVAVAPNFQEFSLSMGKISGIALNEKYSGNFGVIQCKNKV